MTDSHTYSLINHQTRELAFNIQEFDDLSHFDKVQRLNYYSLIWIYEGEGEAVVGFNSYDYQANHLFSFTPYQPFLFNSNKPSKGISIHFHSDFFCIHKHDHEVSCNGVLFNNIYDSPFVKIDDNSISSFQMILQGIKQDLENNPMAVSESILSYLKLFLIHAARLRDMQRSQGGDSKVEEAFVPQKLRDLIESDFRSKHSPKDYADSLHLTPKALGKISKKYFNKTLTTLIAERVIVEAKRELYLTNKTVKEIAFELGYEDEFYFSRFFKKNTSITPSEFRQTVGFGKAEEMGSKN
ncbi:MAG: helix-turn-helix transcriptional regulator [Bacteroidia bacterium]|nr:helix-turn-helix transcriptional regulator [Bacteroidia bacterium]